jgi:hypothetical protein
MRQKAFEDIRLAPELKAAMIEHQGREPDNFVESREATIENLPDLEGDPEARQLLSGLDDSLNELVEERRRSTNGDRAHRDESAEDDSGDQ